MKKSLLKRMFGIEVNKVHYFAEPADNGGGNVDGETILGGAGGGSQGTLPQNEPKPAEPAAQPPTQPQNPQEPIVPATEDKPQDPKAREPKPDETKDKSKAEPKADPSAVEYTDFKFPQGITPDDKLIGGFKALAKELNLTQEQAQKFVDLQSNSALAYAKAGQEAHITTLKKWQYESNQFLGADKEKKLSQAAKALSLCGAEKELRDIFDKTGLGNHPAFVKLLVFAGQQIADDVMPNGAPPSASKKGDAETLYGGLNM